MKEPYTAPAMVRRGYVRPNSGKALYLAWDDTELKFEGWDYAGGGVTEPVMRAKHVTRRARWTSTADIDDILRALEFIHRNRPDAWIELGEQ